MYVRPVPLSQRELKGLLPLKGVLKFTKYINGHIIVFSSFLSVYRSLRRKKVGRSLCTAGIDDADCLAFRATHSSRRQH